MADKSTPGGLKIEIESAMKRAWPAMTEHDLGVVRDDIATLCRVLREQHDLLRPLVAFKRALERNRSAVPDWRAA